MTNPESIRTYEGDEAGLDSAWSHFVDANDLPSGQIAAALPEVEDGAPTADTDILRNDYSDGQSFSRESFFDLTDIIGGFAGGSSALKALRSGGTLVSGTSQVSRLDDIFIITGRVDDAATASATVVMGVEYVERLDDIENSKMTEAQKNRARDALYTEAAVTGGLVIAGNLTARNRVSAQLLTVDGLPGVSLTSTMSGADLDRLISHHGRDTVVWAGTGLAPDQSTTLLQNLDASTLDAVSDLSPSSVYAAFNVEGHGVSTSQLRETAELVEQARVINPNLTNEQIEFAIDAGATRPKQVASPEIASILDARGAESVWDDGWSYRGKELERQALADRDLSGGIHMDTANDYFRVIDDFTDGVATSVKSRDITGTSYAGIFSGNPSRFVSVIEADIDSVAEFLAEPGTVYTNRPGQASEITVRAEEIESRQLIVVLEDSVRDFPPPDFDATMEALQTYADDRGVELVFDFRS